MSKDVKMRDLSGRNRFKLTKVLANTLQGRIYLAQDKTGQYQWTVVKETWRELVKQQKSRDGHRVPENFEREKKIQLYLSELPDQKDGYVRCIDNWDDDNCYYLAMEHCSAGELFEYIRDNHTKGEQSKLVKEASSKPQKCQDTLNDWTKCLQSMFRQLVETVSWMHSHQIAHLDLSLENTMLSSVEQNLVKIKIIDFGLARDFKWDEKFTEKVGKIGYMAPEVYGSKKYSPEKADIWCLGVMLFMMLVGAPPYEFPNPTNPAFRFIISGRLRDVLAHWRRLPLVPSDALDVMEKILKPENERITMQDLRRHKFVGLTIATGNDQSLKINNNVIPDLKTTKAREMALKLRDTVGQERMRSFVTSLEVTINDFRIPAAPGVIQNPNSEGVIDQHDNSHKNEECVIELKNLVQLAKDALDCVDAT